MTQHNKVIRCLNAVPIVKTMVGICSILILLPFVINNAEASYINCPSDVDLEKYPICNYEEDWNTSEKFAALVNDRFNVLVLEFYDEDHNDLKTDDEKLTLDEKHDLYNERMWNEISKIYKTAQSQIREENPGLEEQCWQIKADIYESLGKLDWFLSRIQ